MNKQIEKDEDQLRQLYYDFLDTGLHGRFEESLAFIEEPYAGVGMGEQGIVRSKAEAELVVRDGYRSEEGAAIDVEVRNLIVNRISDDVAFLVGEVTVTNASQEGRVLRTGMMQSVGASRRPDGWKINFTHSSPTVLTAESVEAYPIRFMDHTLSALKADLQAESGAHRDALTGILNRDGFDRCVARLMEDYNPKHNTALLLMDLDDFKQINDRLGHQTGDMVLKQVAETLRGTFRASDIVARIGGDEFMVFLSGDFTSKFLENKARQLLNTMRLRVDGEQQLPISVSIGVAYGRARVTFEKLYRIADIALYTAKRAGKARYHLINSDTNSQSSYSGTGSNLLSLQTMLEYMGGKDILESKTPYEALLENIPGGVVMFDVTETEVKRTQCNDWFTNRLGYSEEEIRQQQENDPMVLVHPDDVPLIVDAMASIREGAEGFNIVFRARHKDGRYLHVNEITTVTERRPDSIVLYGLESDVDELVRLKGELERSHKELEAVVTSLPGSVVMLWLTENGVKPIHRTPWFAQLLGYSEDELVALLEQNPMAICHPDDVGRVLVAAQAIRDGADSDRSIYRVRHKDGHYSHVEQNVTVVERKADGIFLCGLTTDAEKSHRLEQELAALKQQLPS